MNSGKWKVFEAKQGDFLDGAFIEQQMLSCNAKWSVKMPSFSWFRLSATLFLLWFRHASLLNHRKNNASRHYNLA